MIQSLFVLNGNGEVLIERQCQPPAAGAIGSERTACRVYWEQVVAASPRGPGDGSSRGGGCGDLLWYGKAGSVGDQGVGAPARAVCYVWAQRLTFLADVDAAMSATSRSVMTPALVLDFLENTLVPLVRTYCGGQLTEDALRENFVVIYELLEEVLDNGFPSTTELSALLPLVPPSSATVLGRMMEAVTGACRDSSSSSVPGGAHRPSNGGVTGRPPHGPSAGTFASAAESLMAAWQGSTATRPHLPSSSSSIAADAVGAHTASPLQRRGSAGLPWRSPGTRHPHQEIFIDLVERIEAILSGGHGEVIRGTVHGTIECQTQLSGMPELVLRLRDTEQAVDDMAFHRCVRLDAVPDCDASTVTFVPPDGAFTLASYTRHNLWTPPVNASGTARPFPLRVTYRVSTATESPPAEPPSATTSNASAVPRRHAPPTRSLLLHITLHALVAGDQQVEDVIARLPFTTTNASSRASAPLECRVRASSGIAAWDPLARALRWSLPRLASHTSATLTATVSPAGSIDAAASVPTAPILQLSFRIPRLSVCGLGIERLQVLRATHPPYKGMRCVTHTANVEVRPAR
ncbi:hypothetical protein CDCA_CDCA17G4419 [Cyanidium caldarium]|uniref:MHD domain-containing protein n=1 Tax=Cyanidium caldarium TaxID=2771 RepID=A0AAV9J1M4_CYACA|nr:hypothetical protein CDCA_CDCA17G4419 [Cyanidium caldarium]